MVENSLQSEKWVARYGDYLFSIAMMKTGDRETAQDLVQETFLSAVKAKDTFNGLSSEKTWLSAILKNKVIDYYRKKDVLKETTRYLEETDTSFYGSFFDLTPERHGHWNKESAPAAWAESADNLLEKNEFYKVLQYCLNKMPSKLMPAFVAKYMDDEDTEKICKDLNLTPSNYWVMIHRAKVLMRSCLEKNWFLK